MTDSKSVTVSMRVTPRFKRLLEVAAEREQRTQTNLLEWLLTEHCRQVGLVRVRVTKPAAKS